MANRFWVGGGSSSAWTATGNTNWSATSGGANNASVPGASDAAIFDAASAAASLLSANITVLSLVCTGYVGTLTHNAGVTLTGSVGGAFTFSVGMTYVPANPNTSILTVGGALTTAGQTLGRLRTLDGSTVTLQDNLACGSLVHTGFTPAVLTATTQTVTASGAVSLGRETHMGSGTWTVRSWQTAFIGGAIDPETATVVLVVESATSFNAGEVYAAVRIEGPAVGPVSILSSPTIGTLTITDAPKTLDFEAGGSVSTTTFICQGAPGALMTLESDAPGVGWSLGVGATSTAAYCAVQDSGAVGAGTPINDTLGGVDNGGNSGWLFPGGAPGVGLGGSAELGGKLTFPGDPTL